MDRIVLVPLANGFEEIEAVSVIDILRRAGIKVLIAGLDREFVVGAHGIEIKTDLLLKDVEENELDMVVLPGGMPGAKHLLESNELKEIVLKLDRNNRRIGAICAAPWVLGEFGVLKDNYTCYPSFETNIKKGSYHKKSQVVSDHNIITANGPASAMEFALEIVKELKGDAIYQEIKNGLLFK